MLEIVWVSADRSAEEYVGYFEKMPWLAVPIQGVAAVTQALGSKLGVKGIPHLALLSSDGTIITLDGRKAVLQDPHGLSFPWRPKGAALLSLAKGLGAKLLALIRLSLPSLSSLPSTMTDIVKRSLAFLEGVLEGLGLGKIIRQAMGQQQ